MVWHGFWQSEVNLYHKYLILNMFSHVFHKCVRVSNDFVNSCDALLLYHWRELFPYRLGGRTGLLCYIVWGEYLSMRRPD